jgi:hypothetical protein
MKIFPGLLSAAFATLAIAAGPARAMTVWDWTLSGGGVNASGTFDTAGDGSTPSAVTFISGTYSDGNVTNGTIDGLVPLGTDSRWIYDNMFGGSPVLSNPGILFDVGGLHVNVFTDPGFISGVNVGGSYQLTNVSFTAAVVPEPATLALMLAGLGALAVKQRRKLRA